MKRFTMLFLAVFSVLALVSCDNGSDDPTTPCADPAVPALASPAAGATVQGPDVAVDWDSAANATGYLAELYTGAGCSGAAEQNIATASTQGTWTALTAGRTYSWRVRSINAVCDPERLSAWSECRSFAVTLECLAPAAPALASPAAGASVEAPDVAVDWDASANATHYVAELYGGGSCSGAAQGTLDTASTNGTWRGLAASATFSWRVRAENRGCNPVKASPWSDCRSFTTSATTCPTPGTPEPKSPCNVAVNRTDVEFSWKTAANATHYKAEVYVGGGCSSTEVQTLQTQSPKTSAAIPLLESLQTYSWRVRSENRNCSPAKNSGWSDCCPFNTFQ